MKKSFKRRVLVIGCLYIMATVLAYFIARWTGDYIAYKKAQRELIEEYEDAIQKMRQINHEMDSLHRSIKE